MLPSHHLISDAERRLFIKADALTCAVTLQPADEAVKLVHMLLQRVDFPEAVAFDGLFLSQTSSRSRRGSHSSSLVESMPVCDRTPPPSAFVLLSKLKIRAFRAVARLRVQHTSASINNGTEECSAGLAEPPDNGDAFNVFQDARSVSVSFLLPVELLTRSSVHAVFLALIGKGNTMHLQPRRLEMHLTHARDTGRATVCNISNRSWNASSAYEVALRLAPGVHAYCFVIQATPLGREEWLVLPPDLALQQACEWFDGSLPTDGSSAVPPPLRCNVLTVSARHDNEVDRSADSVGLLLESSSAIETELDPVLAAFSNESTQSQKSLVPPSHASQSLELDIGAAATSTTGSVNATDDDASAVVSSALHAAALKLRRIMHTDIMHAVSAQQRPAVAGDTDDHSAGRLSTRLPVTPRSPWRTSVKPIVPLSPGRASFSSLSPGSTGRAAAVKPLSPGSQGRGHGSAISTRLLHLMQGQGTSESPPQHQRVTISSPLRMGPAPSIPAVPLTRR